MAMTPEGRAVFLDKDGTLVDDVPYNVDPERISLAPGAATALPRLQRSGFRLVVVSNQSGVAREIFSESALEAVRIKLAELIKAAGARLDGFYCCVHGPGDGCGCRKPEPGLLHQAARELSLNLDACWLVGDILDDIEAGRRAGCRTVLIDNGNETEWRSSPGRQPHFIACDLDEASQYITASIQEAEWH